MKALILFAIAVLLTGCGPSCSERGGHQQFAYFITTFTMVNNQMIPIQTAVYECVGAVK